MKSPYSEPDIRHRYRAVAIALHWLLALTLSFQLALGAAMPKDATGYAPYQLHKSVGILILLLTLLRLAWRLAHPPPPPVERGLTAGLAKAVHAGFYLVLVLAPLTGWMLVSTAPIDVPTVLFGAVPWPHLPLAPNLHQASLKAHELLSWIGFGLVLLHVAGALRHQFILRHSLLQRMAPGGSAVLAGVLATVVAAVGIATFVLVAGPELTPDTAEPPDRTAAPDLALADSTRAHGSEQSEGEAERAAVAAGTSPEAEQPPAWTVQPGGGLEFSVGSGADTFHGSFADWSGRIRFDPDSPDGAVIAIDVDPASASLGDSTLDRTLRSAEFLAAATHPRATWRATSVSRTGPGRYDAQGTLMLKGIRRSQPLTFTLSGEGPRRRVQGRATVDRTAFDIGLGPSGADLTPLVVLEFSFEAVREAP